MGWEEKKVALVWRGRESVSESVTVRGFEIFFFFNFFFFYGLGLDNVHTLSNNLDNIHTLPG